jgi:hypothetical protein
VLDADPELRLVSALEVPSRRAIDGFSAVLGEERAGALMRQLDRRGVSAATMREHQERLRSIAEARPHVREEALCDVIASITTMRIFNPQPTLAAPALILALSNHTTMAMLRQRAIALQQRPPTPTTEDDLATTALRGDVLLQVWRRLAEQNESREALASMAKYVLLLRGRHDFHVRVVAESTPFLLRHGSQIGTGERRRSAVQELRQDTLDELKAHPRD